MKKALGLVLVLATTMFMAACGGGGDNSHQQLAQNFVSNLNASGQLQVTLVKANTDQKNFIVVYNAQTDQYLAVNLDNYSTGQDAYAYFTANQGRFFYDLDVIPAHDEVGITSDYNGTCQCYTDSAYTYTVPTAYRDRHADLTFEKVESSPKDLEKMAALKEAIQMNQTVQNLQSNFGLSAERSVQVARLTTAWQKAGGKDLTNAEHDAFSKEVLGFTITQAKAAMTSNDQGSIDALINKAAQINGTTSENVREILKGFSN